MRRRTVRGDMFKSSAASSMVRSLVTARPRTTVVCEPVSDVGLGAGLEPPGGHVSGPPACAAAAAASRSRCHSRRAR